MSAPADETRPEWKGFIAHEAGSAEGRLPDFAAHRQDPETAKLLAYLLAIDTLELHPYQVELAERLASGEPLRVCR